MCQNSVALNLSGGNKCRLQRRYDLGEHCLQSVGQNFGDDFVNNVAQDDRPKVVHCLITRLFWNRSNVSVI
jgi:hypothetical protein